MKKVILASVVAVAAVSGDAGAVTGLSSFCAGGNAMSFSIAADQASSATDFVKSNFNARCSANVILVGEDASLYYRVGSASVKGKQRFGGSTMGGGVTGTSCNTNNTVCNSQDAVDGATNAASQ